jgi:formate dehydrogenase major subunit
VAITAPPDVRTVTLSIDGQELTVPEGTTIWDAAKSAGIEIPVLCHDERYDPVGVCRVCAVDVGARVYAAACVRPCEDGMEVKTATPEVEQRRARLGPVALGPAISVLGMKRGGTEARPQPRPARPPDQAAGS